MKRAGSGDEAAKVAFIAGLPRGKKGDLIPGHTTWNDLGRSAQERYRRMAQAAIEAYRIGGPHS